MKVSEQDAKLFFKLMGALQTFVNQKLKLFPQISDPEDLAGSSFEEKYQIRKAVYEESALINLFVQENPYNFTEDELNIISSWKDFISDSFHIERILKKYGRPS